MKNIIDDIKNQEMSAQKIIDDAQKNAKQNLEKEKMLITSQEETELKNHQKVLDEFIQTAEKEAQKETEEINKNKKNQIDRLSKIDIENGTQIVLNEIFNI